MNQSLTRLSFAAALASWSLAGACSDTTTSGDPATTRGPDRGNDNYGQALIGYKNAGADADAAGVDSSGIGAAFNGGYASGGTSTYGPLPVIDEGAAGSSLGGAAGSGSLDFKSLGPIPGVKRAAGVLENPYFSAKESSTSTFSIDVDSGSFTLARAAIRDGVLPAAESVRVEEFLNYFHFHYQEPTGDVPLALYTELGDCPWDPGHDLLMLGVQGQEVKVEDAPPANLVYLLDVSGSMSDPLKLPLLKRGFRMLTRQLRPEDKVSIVTYAGSERVVLEGVSGADKDTIDSALVSLESGGSTNGQGGIQKAYELAQEHFIEGGTNRVLLATDGDFNVGLSQTDELVDFIAEKRETGVFLSVYGFGTAWDGGNYKDEVGEQLADNGNGIYFYIDGDEEARRAFMYTISGSLITVAKDVKLQVEFNPAHVEGYRLIGYENRVLSNDSFDDDTVDAGELGAGLSVTALYEIIPAGSGESIPEPLEGTVPELGGSETNDPSGEKSEEAPRDYPALAATDIAQIRIRYKNTDENTSQLMVEARNAAMRREQPSLKFLFAAGLSEFAQLLRGSQYLDSERYVGLQRQIDLALTLDGEGAVAETSRLFADAVELMD